MADRDLSGRRLGEFVLREQIGEGGYGAVYRCEQPVLKRDAVIKILHDRRRTSDVAQERFLREARLASRLDHPYAAHIYAFGVEQEDGLLWIAMELVHGITLDRWLATRGPMSLDQLVPFFERVAQVVQAAHDCGIVHRDLKPTNVMVIERGGRLLPKLLDFGIAKADEVAPVAPPAWPEGSIGENDELASASGADGVVTARIRVTPTRVQRTRTNPDRAMAALPNGPELTGPGAGLGSAAYMSPEQWNNACAVGPASDIYSLGVVVYEALTGHAPFIATNTDDYYRCHLNGAVPHLSGDFSSDLDRVLQRALAKSPEARHGNVLELAAELRAALRATEREQLRISALQWGDRAQAPGLLWGPDVLADYERWTRRAPSGALSALECSFVAASQRRARRGAWIRRAGVGLAVIGALGIAMMQVRLAREQTRSAERLANATITQSELEQGRAALLHGEPDAQTHLAEAYKRDPAPSTAFMLARALQPRLAELARFSSTSGRMWSAAFSPDGRQIVTTDDKNAQVWDAQTYQRLYVLPHGDVVYQAVYTADGTRIVSTGSAGVVRIWDAARGTLERELHHAGSEQPHYCAVAVSPDGGLVAAINPRGDVADVWETATGILVAELPNDGSEFPAVAFSADGRWLATTGGNDVRVFDTHTRQRAVTLPGPRIHSLAFDPTGPRLVTGAATGDAAIWAIPSGERVRHLREFGESVDAVAVSPDGQLVVAGSRDGTEQVWRAASGELLSQLNARRSKIFAVEFDRTSKLVLAAGLDGTVVVVDAGLGMPVTVLEGPQNAVRAAHFDPSSRHVLGASIDGTVRVWDASAPYRRWSSSANNDDCGVGTTPEPQTRFIAISCKTQPTQVWDTSRDQLLAELPSVSHVDGNFTSAFPAVAASGERAAIVRGNAVEVYELPGGRVLRTIAHGAPVNAVGFASTGREIVTGAVDGSLLVTSDDGTRLALPVAPGGIDAVSFLPDGRLVASDSQRRLHVYDRRGVLLADVELPTRAMSLRADGSRLVTVPIAPTVAASMGPPVLIDLQRYRVIAQLGGHVGRVFSARWVGHQILTAGGDGTARMWDGATGQSREIYRGGSRLLSDATLTPEGLVVAGGVDGVLRFWDRESARLLWTLPAHKSQIIGLHAQDGDIVTRAVTGEVSRWTLPTAANVIDACSDQERCAIVPR